MVFKPVSLHAADRSLREKAHFFLLPVLPDAADISVDDADAILEVFQYGAISFIDPVVEFDGFLIETVFKVAVFQPAQAGFFIDSEKAF